MRNSSIKKHEPSDYGAVYKRRWQLGGGEGSKMSQNCRRIVLKNCRIGGGQGGIKNPEKLPTSLMDGPYQEVFFL